MADPTPTQPVEQTGPLDVGTSTSEFKLTIGGIVTIVLTVGGGLLAMANQLQAQFPEWGWLGPAVAVLGGVVSIAALAMKYVGGRTDIKTAAVQLKTVQVASAVLEPSPTTKTPALVPTNP